MPVLYILYLTDQDTAPDEALFSFLPKERTEKISRFAKNPDKLRCFAAGLAALAAASEYFSASFDNVRLIMENWKAPYAICNGRTVHLSISHSGKYVVCVASEARCGIDTEEIDTKKNISLISDNYFHVYEAELLRSFSDENKRIAYFFFLWTMKEAYLKYLGVGLRKKLSSFWVEKNTEKIIIRDTEASTECLKCSSFFKSGNCFSIVSHEEISEVKEYDFSEFAKMIRKAAGL